MEQTPTENYLDSYKKQKIGKWISVVLISLAAFLIVQTINQIKQYGYIGKSESVQNVITVSGKGEVLAIPDIVTLSFTVQEESSTVNSAQEKATQKTNAAIDFLKKSGISEKDIKTSGYNIYPRYEYQKQFPGGLYPIEGKQVLAAYVVSESLEVKVRKIEEAGKILSGIGELGVSNVSGLNFTNDKQDDLKKQAREKAIIDARKDADKLANDLGVSIVRIVNFSESGNYGSPMYFKTLSADVGRGGASAPPSPEIPAGENKITSEVTITYEIR